MSRLSRLLLSPWLFSLVISIGCLLIISRVAYLDAKRIHRLLIENPWPKNAHLPDQELGFRIAPNLNSPMRDQSFFLKTHDLGYRIGEKDSPTQLNTKGTLAIGCSFTFGADEKYENTFAYWLQQKSEAPVYNFGVASYSYVTSLLYLKKIEAEGKIQTLKPKVVLLGAGAWLESRSTSPFYPTQGIPGTYPYLTKKGNALVIGNAIPGLSTAHAFKLANEYAEESKQKAPTFNQVLLMSEIVPIVWYARLVQRAKISRFFRSTVTADDLYQYVFDELFRFSERTHTKIAVLWMPHLPNEKPTDPFVHALQAYPNILVIDGTQALAERGIKYEEYVLRHPSPLAHRIYGEATAKALKPFFETSRIVSSR